MTEHVNPIALIDRVNPYRNDALAAIPGRDERLERTWESISHRINSVRPATSARFRVGRRSVFAAAAIAALALPALALSGVGGFFGFGNPGTPVSTGQVDLSDVQILRQDKVDIGAGVKLLAVRNGIAFYASRRDDGATCLLTGAANGSAPTTITIGTPCEADFPSSAQPILGQYALKRSPLQPRAGAGGVQAKLGPPTVSSVAGLAADGVATVEALDTKGAVILEAPVTNNVYSSVSASNAPAGPAAEIVALDAAGNRIYSERIPQMGTGG
jgi:hypothetical protein